MVGQTLPPRKTRLRGPATSGSARWKGCARPRPQKAATTVRYFEVEPLRALKWWEAIGTVRSERPCIRRERRMCLAIPGKVVEIYEDRGLLMGRIDFAGTIRKASLAHVPEARVGD